MAHDFTEFPREPEPQPSPSPGIRPPARRTGTDLLDQPEAFPPRGLMHKRAHISFWLGIALVLGCLVALVLAVLVLE